MQTQMEMRTTSLTVYTLTESIVSSVICFPVVSYVSKITLLRSCLSFERSGDHIRGKNGSAFSSPCTPTPVSRSLHVSATSGKCAMPVHVSVRHKSAASQEFDCL